MCPVLEELLLWTYNVLWSLKNYLCYQMQALVKRYPFKRNFKCHRSCISGFPQNLAWNHIPTPLDGKMKEEVKQGLSTISCYVVKCQPPRGEESWPPTIPPPALSASQRLHLCSSASHREVRERLKDKLGKVRADGKATGQKNRAWLPVHPLFPTQCAYHTPQRPHATRGLWRLCHRITCYVESDEHTVDTGISNANTVFKNGALL